MDSRRLQAQRQSQVSRKDAKFAMKTKDRARGELGPARAMTKDMPTIQQDSALDEDHGCTVDVVTEVRREAALLKTGALQNAILNSANFSSIATDEKGVIQLFNVGAERMLGYTAIE